MYVRIYQCEVCVGVYQYSIYARVYQYVCAHGVRVRVRVSHCFKPWSVCVTQLLR